MSDLTCPSCGHANQGLLGFCSSCGASLVGDATGETPAIDVEGTDLTGIDVSEFGRHQGLFVVVQGAKTGARYALDEDLVTMGRHPKSTVFFDDITVSRRHAEIRRDGARYWVVDAGSLNGTYVNRQRVDERELSDGDEVQIGKYRLVFVHGTGAA